jgi:hypothetical protein
LVTVHLDNLCNGNQLVALFIINLLRQPPFVSGVFITHHQEVFTVCVQHTVT